MAEALLYLAGTAALIAAYTRRGSTVPNEGTLGDADVALRTVGAGDTQLHPVSGIGARSPLSACAGPSGVGVASRLLPPPGSPAFTDADFVGITPEKLAQQNWLTASDRTGLDTTNGASKIANYDLRAWPAIERTLTITTNAFANSPYPSHGPQRSLEIGTIEPSDLDTHARVVRREAMWAAR